MAQLSRRACLSVLTGVGVGTVAFQRSLAAQVAANATVTNEMIQQAQWIAGEELTEEEQTEVADTLEGFLKSQAELRAYAIDPDTPLATAFVPHFFADPEAAVADLPKLNVSMKWSKPLASGTETASKLPGEEDIAYASIQQLGGWIRSQQISSVDLTKLYLKRLHKYNSVLNCVVNFADEIALGQAAAADADLAAGNDRGPLHGIPWAAKDIIAIPGLPTTWGVDVYEERERKSMATVAERMQSAGAVLLAKVAVGTMAWGDKWFGGTTRNPWNPEQGSSGSSAGSASAAAAGLCGFALGTETYGSIVSPCRRCSVTGLRPSFGRVSRAGVMTLGWTLDKIGPIARNVEDCAAVFSQLLGADGKDPTVVHRDFHWPQAGSTKSSANAMPISERTIGYVEGELSESEKLAFEQLQSDGAKLVPIQYPDAAPMSPLLSCLDCEATTMHDDLFRSDIEEATLGNWGSVFRGGQWMPAVHYLKGLRVRTQVIAETEATLKTVDVVLGGNDLLRTNLSGHPSLIVALGSRDTRQGPRPRTIKLTAKMFAEDALLSVGQHLQEAIPSDGLRPELTPAE